MRLLVFGGRDYANVARLQRVLCAIHAKRPITLIIEGGAKGADRLAREWAIANGIPYVTEEANWARDGAAAGPMRNAAMLRKHSPEGAVAFPGGRGTADMAAKCEAAGVKLMRVES